MTRKLSFAAFGLGAALVIWMGLTFINANLLALIVTIAIGFVYAVGFAELLRFQQATATLQNNLDGLNDKITDLDSWISRLHPSLHNGVRLRIEGEHIGLPAPVVTPYLVGLLVMLGLLGTFVGMVDTLKGAVMALEGTTELEAVRAGLAAPIKGLSMAFGTSVAGVAASAMLGFISTISRRDRMLASRLLDSKVSTVFQDYSLAYNRQQTFKAMQVQAEALPQVAQQLTDLAGKLSQLSDDVGTQLVENQQKFHDSAQSVYNDLAQSVGESLKQSLAESGRLAGESIQPVVKEIMEGINRETQATHQQLTASVTDQLETLSQRFSDTSDNVNQAWQSGLSAHENSNQQLISELGSTLQGFSQQFTESSAQLIDSVSNNSQSLLKQQSAADAERLQQWTDALTQSQNAAADKLSTVSATITEQMQQISERQQSSIHSITDDFRNSTVELNQQLQQAAEASAKQQQAVSDSLQQSAASITSNSAESARQVQADINKLLASSEQLVQQRIDNEAAWLERYNERMESISSSLTAELSALRDAETERGEAAVQRLSDLQTAVTEHLAELGSALEAPMTRLIETASETPKAAAEVIEKLRSEITKNLERDNTLLEERRRTMEELNNLSSAMETSASSQREAIEQMANASAEMLKEVAGNFTDHVSGEVVKLTDIVDHFSGSASEISSLGEAFGAAVQLFTDSNTQLMEKLTVIESTLIDAGTRSDEQLAYYVAQAREIIDHNVMSQQEIINQIRSLSRSGELTEEESA